MTGSPSASREPEAVSGRPLRSRSWAVASVVVAAGHLAALYWPRITVEGPVAWTDKLVHPLLFLVPMLVWSRWWGRWQPVAAVLAAHAVVSEVVQHGLLPHRSGDPWDSVADLLGVGVGILAAVVLRRAGRSAASRPQGAVTSSTNRW
ncbi:VanZ family protein [Dermatophilaceae bacterium Soc4.6]